MKPILQKLLSAALAVCLLLPPLPARASEALGHDLAASGTELNRSVTLSDGTFWSDTYSDLRQENYVVYTPSEQVKPVVTYGETARALTTVRSAARELEGQGWRVLAGINGDYYGVAHGIPIGTTMVNGVLRNISCDPYYAVGFRADGSAMIGDPQLTIHAIVNGGSGFPIYSFNHVRQSEYGIFLYDSRFNDRHTTGTSEPGIDVICSEVEGSLTIGGMLTLGVDEVLTEVSDTQVPEGKYVISVNLKASEGYTDPVEALKPGDLISVSVASQSDTAWNAAVELIGAPELLVQGGEVQPGLPTGAAPRTAIGQRADGSLVFYTIDGRKAGYSIGATLTAVAMRMVELGCVTAVALDGGGSTTMVATLPHETAARVVNRPSEGSERAVSNHVLLVTPNTPSGRAEHVYLAAPAARALPGAKLTLTSAVIDTNGIPMPDPVSIRSDGGSYDGGVLTLPDTVGRVTVTGSYGSLSAAAEIETVLPESIVVRRAGTPVTSVTIPPETSVSLTAEGVTNHLTLAGDNECFTWRFAGEGIAVSEDGATLTAGAGAGAGTLYVGIGEKTVELPVNVAAVPLRTLDGFEQTFEPLSSGDGALTMIRSATADYVRFGRASAQLDYRLAASTPATVPVEYALGAEYNCVELWALGSGNGVRLTLETDVGPAAPVTLGFTGYRALSIALPSGARTLTGLTLSSEEELRGTLWLDQLVLAYDNLVDAYAPELSLAYSEEAQLLMGHAFDAVNGAALPTLRLTYDGKPLPHTFDGRTGALTAALPAYDGCAHYVTLTAGDAAGNLARRSLYIPAADALPPAFPDLGGHWCNPSAEYLMRTGISNGSDGRYKPDDNITRQEFATMLYRYLAPEQDFSGVELPFHDNDRIASWARDAARAMYSLGVVGGGKDADGNLCFMPEANINRQEAATMLGRLFEKGYASFELLYADAASVPGWAASHVAFLSASGVFEEFIEGSFEPTRPLTRAEMASMLLRIN